MTKDTLREQYKALRSSLSEKEKQAFDRKLTESILSLPEFKAAVHILLFASVGSEFDTRAVFRESLKSGKRVYFPKCFPNRIMEFFEVNGENDLAIGKYGIPEPVTSKKYINDNDTALAVVPALAVGRDFSRLGYGGGYYDRFLMNFNGVTVCPVYPFALCDSVPTHFFDVPQKIIITPNEIIRR